MNEIDEGFPQRIKREDERVSDNDEESLCAGDCDLS
jgi:hypothetical protein